MVVAGVLALLGFVGGEFFWVVSSATFLVSIIGSLAIKFEYKPTIAGTLLILCISLMACVVLAYVIKYVLIGSVVANGGKELLFKDDE
jgi:hypothetical protein